MTGTACGAVPRRSTDVRARSRRDQTMLRDYAQCPTARLREHLIKRFMPLARSLAWRYRSNAEPIEDLVQVASEGLVRAVDGYDPARGVLFSSYATPVILGALRHHFRDSTRSVHMPRGLGERIQKVRGAQERLGGTLGRSGGYSAQLATDTGLSQSQVDEALKADADCRPVSVDRTQSGFDDADTGPLLDMLGCSEAGYERAESSAAAEGAELSARERSVLVLRFDQGMSQRAAGAKLGISQMQVSRIQRRALTKLLDAIGGAAVPVPGPT